MALTGFDLPYITYPNIHIILMVWRGESIACTMSWAVVVHSSHWSDFRRIKDEFASFAVSIITPMAGDSSFGISSPFSYSFLFLFSVFHLAFLCWFCCILFFFLVEAFARPEGCYVIWAAGNRLQPLFRPGEITSRKTVKNCCLHPGAYVSLCIAYPFAHLMEEIMDFSCPTDGGLFLPRGVWRSPTEADNELLSTIRPCCLRNYCLVLVRHVGFDSMYNVYAEGFLSLMLF